MEQTQTASAQKTPGRQAEGQPILRLERVKKYYGNHGNITKAVDGITLHIDSVTSGHIFVSGKDITAVRERDLADFRRENLGFIFQDFHLLDTLTIGENISMAQIISGTPPKVIDRRVRDIAGKLGISGILEKFPCEVSGGQKQRCACARALINEPKLILADEPTGALDSRSSRLLLETMASINEKLGATILMVTHDPFCASF